MNVFVKNLAESGRIWQNLEVKETIDILLRKYDGYFKAFKHARRKDFRI